MTRRFAAYLGCTGVLAVLAITVPGLVLAGLFLGIVPGIMLAAAPTLFLYSVPWWAVRELLLRGSALVVRPESDTGKTALRRAVGGFAIVILAIPAILVPRTLNARIERAAEALRAEDREITGPLALPPVVAVVINERDSKTLECDTICQRLLYNGAVSRIVEADTIPPTTVEAFWIERRIGRCPDAPFPVLDIRWPNDWQKGKYPEQRVQDRIAAGECLIKGNGNIEEAALTISYQQIKKGVSIFSQPWELAPDTVSAARLEITERDGHVLYRRTEVTAAPLAVPLTIETRAGLLTTATYAGWGRSETTYGQVGPQGRDVLPSLLGSAGRPPDEPAP